MRVWEWLIDHSTLTLTVKDDDACIRVGEGVVSGSEFLKRIRRVDVDTTLRGQKVALIPAPGTHWFGMP